MDILIAGLIGLGIVILGTIITLCLIFLLLVALVSERSLRLRITAGILFILGTILTIGTISTMDKTPISTIHTNECPCKHMPQKEI